MGPRAITVTKVPGRMIKRDLLWRMMPWSEWCYRIRPLAWFLISLEWVHHQRKPWWGRRVSCPSQQGCGMTWIWDGLGHRPWGPANTLSISKTACFIHGYGLCGEMSFSWMTSPFESFITQFLNRWYRYPVRPTVIFFCPFPLLQVCPKLLSLSHTNLLHLQEATLASFPTRHPPWDLKTSSHTVPLPDVVSPNSG